MGVNKLQTYADPILDRQIRDLCDASDPLTGSGDPTGTVTPRYFGDRYYATGTSIWYVSNGTAAADWQEVGSGGGGGSNHNTTVDGGNGWTASSAYIDGGGWA